MKKTYTTLAAKIERYGFYDNTFEVCKDLYDVIEQYAFYNYERALNEIHLRIYESFGIENFGGEFYGSIFGENDNETELVNVLYEPLRDTIQTAFSQMRRQKQKMLIK